MYCVLTTYLISSYSKNRPLIHHFKFLNRHLLQARKEWGDEWKAVVKSSSPSLGKRKMDYVDVDSPESSPCASKKRKTVNQNKTDSDVEIIS